MIKIKNLMDFPDTDMEMVKVRIEAWNKEQQRILKWKEKAFGSPLSAQKQINTSSIGSPTNMSTYV